MSVTLTNSCLTVRIATMGAEIKSIREDATGIEYIWRGDAAWWNGSSPILFPIIGGLRDGTYRFKGQTYSMGGHGIVRKKEWSLITSDATSATYQIESDDETRKQYPFDFVLKVHYRLRGNRVGVHYEVVNPGSGTLYFSIGSHPAINVPFAGGSIEHYYIHFSESETIHRHFFGDGMCLNETAPVFDNSRQIFLTKELFDRGAVILKSPRSKCFAIRNSRNAKQVCITTDGVPYLGLWAPAGAPFACIEPWFGMPDPEDTDGEFSTKEGIQSLQAGETFETAYGIEIV